MSGRDAIGATLPAIATSPLEPSASSFSKVLKALP